MQHCTIEHAAMLKEYNKYSDFTTILVWLRKLHLRLSVISNARKAVQRDVVWAVPPSHGKHPTMTTIIEPNPCAEWLATKLSTRHCVADCTYIAKFGFDYVTGSAPVIWWLFGFLAIFFQYFLFVVTCSWSVHSVSLITQTTRSDVEMSPLHNTVT
jgi:hypothetical protein